MNVVNARSECKCSEEKQTAYCNSRSSHGNGMCGGSGTYRMNMNRRGGNYSCGNCGMGEEEMERVMQCCEKDSAQRGHDSVYGMPLAMGYVPWQQWGRTYEPAEGIGCGTIFPELNLPFLGCIPRDCGCNVRRGGRV